MEMLQQLQTLVKLVAVPTLIAADWQNEPYQMDALKWAGQNRLTIWSTGSLATCSAGPCRELDYFVATADMAAIIMPAMPTAGNRRGLVELVSKVPWSPHSGILLHMQARPRAVTTRILKVPKPLPMGKQSAEFCAYTWKRRVRA